MSQSNAIAGFLALAFIVFITVRGELPVYMGFLLSDPKGGTPTPAPATAASANQKQASSDAANFQNFASTVSKFAAFV